MLASGIGLGIAAGLALGGRFARITSLQIRWLPALVIAVVTRLLAPSLGDLAAAAYVVAFAGIVAVAIANRRLPGMGYVAAGSALNLLVVAANGGMPVDPEAAAFANVGVPEDGLHRTLDQETRLPLLADVIPVGLFRSVYSVGDVLLAFGGFWLPFIWLRRP